MALVLLQQLKHLLNETNPKKRKRRAYWNSLPLEIKKLIIKYAIPDQEFVIDRNSCTTLGSSVAPLLQVNKEMRKLVEANVSHFAILGAFTEPGEFGVYARFALDMTVAPLKVVDMKLPDKFVYPEGLGLDVALPFQKLLSISAEPWSFPDWHPLRIAMVGSSPWEIFDSIPFCNCHWTWKAALPLIKEVTFVHAVHGITSPIADFVSEEILTSGPYCYALGQGHGRGIWLGFRYFTRSRRVQCTPLIAEEIESAWEDAVKVKKLNANSTPLITRIWIEHEEMPPDKPYHAWRELRDPYDDDPAWI
ncbi:hypothetical protein B0J13DRAFT_620492 [Dactylonectria estremocensis]|uniref:F-box domain-containing protein n=1 Tax=Dactylonectria estremocensis TaxID=1079267 RepID=A0A9P9J9A6_9HYPO|nr:hypothetical protein B0J13DRAFT_620492 [Dactylonectria estremocensis]